ncbi:MAG: hypothetical protein QM776_05755 [Rhodocyclaceae bacterium]
MKCAFIVAAFLCLSLGGHVSAAEGPLQFAVKRQQDDKLMHRLIATCDGTDESNELRCAMVSVNIRLITGPVYSISGKEPDGYCTISLQKNDALTFKQTAPKKWTAVAMTDAACLTTTTYELDRSQFATRLTATSIEGRGPMGGLCTPGKQTVMEFGGNTSSPGLPCQGLKNEIDSGLR